MSGQSREWIESEGLTFQYEMGLSPGPPNDQRGDLSPFHHFTTAAIESLKAHNIVMKNGNYRYYRK